VERFISLLWLRNFRVAGIYTEPFFPLTRNIVLVVVHREMARFYSHARWEMAWARSRLWGWGAVDHSASLGFLEARLCLPFRRTQVTRLISPSRDTLSSGFTKLSEPGL
jgi:hypothetical protein